jgi:pyruvate dehydrogenase E2 component (dihydrolipoamide acetyltransferase)
VDASRVEEVKLTGMRKTIAARLTTAKRDVPHYYLTIDCEIDRLLALRKELNAKSPEGEGAYKISVNDFVVRAAALALRDVPEVNSSWAGDKILHHKHSDIGVAVAIEGGLITPILFAAETKGLAQLAREAKDLAGRARDKKLKPQDYEGGSFSISNLGMFGISHFTAVINPPHAAILAVGAGEQRPVVKDGSLQVATVMTMTLSCDHRVIDGAVGAQFLGHMKRYLSDPVTMLL